MENTDKLLKVTLSTVHTTWDGMNFNAADAYKMLGFSMVYLLLQSFRDLQRKLNSETQDLGNKEMLSQLVSWAKSSELRLFLSYMEREEGKVYQDFRQIVSILDENFDNLFNEEKEKELTNQYPILASFMEANESNPFLIVLKDCCGEKLFQEILCSFNTDTPSDDCKSEASEEEKSGANFLTVEGIDDVLQSYINLGKIALQLIVLFEIQNPIGKIYQEYSRGICTLNDFLKIEPDEYSTVDDSDFYKMLIKLEDADQRTVISRLLLIAPGYRFGKWEKAVQGGEEAFFELLDSTALDEQAFNKLATQLKKYYSFAKFLRTSNELDATNINRFVEEAKNLSIPDANSLAQAIKVCMLEWENEEPDFKRLSIAAQTVEIKFKGFIQDIFNGIFEFLSEDPDPLMKMQIEEVLGRKEFKFLVDEYKRSFENRKEETQILTNLHESNRDELVSLLKQIKELLEVIKIVGLPKNLEFYKSSTTEDSHLQHELTQNDCFKAILLKVYGDYFEGSQEMCFIENFTFPDLTIPEKCQPENLYRYKSKQLDGLIIAPKVNVIVEYKSYSGHISIIGDKWFAGNDEIKGGSAENMFAQAKANRDYLFQFFQEGNLRAGKIRSLVVFNSPITLDKSVIEWKKDNPKAKDWFNIVSLEELHTVLHGIVQDDKKGTSTTKEKRDYITEKTGALCKARFSINWDKFYKFIVNPQAYNMEACVKPLLKNEPTKQTIEPSTLKKLGFPEFLEQYEKDYPSREAIARKLYQKLTEGNYIDCLVEDFLFLLNITENPSSKEQPRINCKMDAFQEVSSMKAFWFTLFGSKKGFGQKDESLILKDGETIQMTANKGKIDASYFARWEKRLKDWMEP